MAAPSNVDLFAALAEGEPGPLYYIHGKEHFLVDRAVAILKERTLDPRTRDFNYDAVYAKELGASKIVNLARTLPMMARRRLVLVRDIDALEAKELEGFIPYLGNPSAESCLVFVAEKADMRLKFFTAFKKRGVLLKFDPLAERQLAGFVREEARRLKLRCAPAAAEMIAAEVGADLGQLADAVERLQLYVTGAGRSDVLEEDVEAVVSSTRTRSVFELSDAIGEGNGARALAALGSLLRAREPGLRILAMITRQVRLLMTTRSLLDGGARRGVLAETLGLPPFVVEKLEGQARRFDGETLVAMHRSVYEADQLLKSSKLDDDRWLERLVLELARRGGTIRRGAPQRAGRPG